MKITKQNYLSILEKYDKIRKKYAESDIVPSDSVVTDHLRLTVNDEKAKDNAEDYSYQKIESDPLKSSKHEIDVEVKRFIDSLKNEIENNNNEIIRLEKAIKQYKASSEKNEIIIKDLNLWLSNDYAPRKELSEKSIIEIGDTILFGKYPHNKNGRDQAPIEWIVLNIEGNSALVTSKYAIDCIQYNTSLTGVTWENCSLRKWLNSRFLNIAFSTVEQRQIQNTTVTANKNPIKKTCYRNETSDKIFLLSISETEKYFANGKTRMCALTDYAKLQGGLASGKDTCWWWLRSPGYDQNYAAVVDYVGSVDYGGNSVNYGRACIRPALWINLDT